MTGSIRLAAIVYEAGFPIDDFVGRTVELLRAEHIRLGGALQENVPGGDGRCSAMTLVDLSSHRRFGISQDLGSQAEGCRLDAQGLAEFVALLDRSPDQGVELDGAEPIRHGRSGRRRPTHGLCARDGSWHSDVDRGPAALHRGVGAIPRAAGDRSACAISSSCWPGAAMPCSELRAARRVQLSPAG